MKEIGVGSFVDLHEVIEKYDARTVIYRGIESITYPLIPKIGRIVPPASIYSRQANEQEILRLFQERAFQYLDFNPASDWDWLAIGQQYGLPTRLLDWTDNPLVACFFAVNTPGEDDGVVYSELKRTLNKYGIKRFSLFPGLDGLAAHIEWLQSKRDS